jgi:transcriptional regulator with XRE-family HTH domain
MTLRYVASGGVIPCQHANDTSAFAARLREVRAAAKMTQHEIAERSGVHRQTIAQLETGKRQPTWETAQTLARALGMDCKAFETQPAEEPAKKTTRKRKEKS